MHHIGNYIGNKITRPVGYAWKLTVNWIKNVLKP